MVEGGGDGEWVLKVIGDEEGEGTVRVSVGKKKKKFFY